MQSPSMPHPPVNHVFVDLENVKTIDVSVVGGKKLTFHLFLGPHQKQLGVEVLLENAQTVRLVRSPKRRKGLLGRASSMLGKGRTEAQCEGIVQELEVAGKLSFDEKGAVSYCF